MADWYTGEILKAMPHWQSPPWVDDRGEFDADAYIGAYARAGVRVIVPHAKHVDGYCFFPSRFRAKKPERDFIGEIVSRAKQAGMHVVPYFMVVVDKMSGAEHPEWNCRAPDGSRKDGFGSIFNCINHPGYRELVLGQIAEIQESYDVDGLWSDELSWADDGCFCDSCRRLFGAKTGLDLIAARGTAVARAFFDECWQGVVAEIHRLVARNHPGRIFLYNGGGLHAHSKALFDAYVVSNSCEAHSALFASDRCRRMKTLGKPYEICFLTEKDWGSSVYSTADEAALVACSIVAHGGSLMLSTHQTPRGRLLSYGIEMVAAVNRQVSALREYWEGAESLCDVGVLWPGAEEPKIGMALAQFDIPCAYVDAGQDWSRYPLIYAPALLPRKGAAAQLKDDVDDETPVARAPLGPEAAEKVRAFVENGGVFVAEYPQPGLIGSTAAGGVDFHLSDVLGARFSGKLPFEAHYVKPRGALAEGLPSDLPIYVHGPACVLVPTTAEPRADLVPPLAPLTPLYKLQKNITNAPDARARSTPAVTVNAFRGGLGVMVGLPLARGAMEIGFGKGQNYHFWARKLLANLLFQLLPQPLMRRSTPLGVEAVVNRQPGKGRCVVHLLNNYGLRGIPYGREQRFEPNPETVALADVTVSLNRARIGGVRSARAVVSGQSVRVREDGKWIDVTLPRLTDHEAIVIETDESRPGESR